jgi:glycine betaine/proline transport system ATP-binding protein
MVNGRPAELVSYSSDLDLAGIAESNAMVTGLDRTPMRAAVTVRQLTKRPMILLGDDGALLGVVGEHEIYRGMLRQTEYAKVDTSGPNKVAV